MRKKYYMTGHTVLLKMLLLLFLAITWTLLSSQVFNMLHFVATWTEVINKQLTVIEKIC
jgi:hypothetical protein